MKLVLNNLKTIGRINKNIYGHFSEHLGGCVYGGIWVGKQSEIPNKNGIRTDMTDAMRRIKVPVLRWPGGCFADEYHWEDGIGANRRKMINTNWGGLVEDNAFGTHEFMDLCEQIGAEPYICGNMGSGTVREMAEWIEYITFGGESTITEKRRANGQDKPWKLPYFGIGNESWGGGGNMRPEYYADMYRHFQTFVKDYSGNHITKIACGPSGGDVNWTQKVMERAGNYLDAIALHYYTLPTNDWADKGSATRFDKEMYYSTIRNTLVMKDLIESHCRVMERYDPQKRVWLCIDEWGTWYNPEEGTNPGFLYQQNTMRDAIVAAVNLNLFNNHCDRVYMANIAQAVNVLQAIILTEDEKMILTPTYHAFDLFTAHQNADAIESYIQTEEAPAGVPCLSVSASTKDGVTTVTIVNISVDKDYTVETEFACAEVSGRILTGDMTAHNTFDNPGTVGVSAFAGFEKVNDRLCFTIPRCSVMEITLK
jgi:alpha-N-arabinofuranosidase